MATFENTVMIRRPIEEVFGFLSQFENVPKGNYTIVETRKVVRGTRRRGDDLPSSAVGSESE